MSNEILFRGDKILLISHANMFLWILFMQSVYPVDTIS